VPFAEAVVFAMLASYLLSVTLVLTLAKYWLKPHAAHATGRGILARFEAGFDRLRAGITPCWKPLCAAVRVSPASFCLRWRHGYPRVPARNVSSGSRQDFFPTVDSGQMLLHLRARTGLRIEETAALCDAVEATIRQSIRHPSSPPWLTTSAFL